MHRETNQFRSGVSPFLLLFSIGLALAAGSEAHAQIDYSIDRTVWMMLYDVTSTQMNSAAWLAADSDGDGLSNGSEQIAGTNPFDPKSNIAVTSVSQGSNGMTFTFPTQAGKLYSVQSATTLSATSSWAALSPAVQVEGTGGPMELAAPDAGGKNTFYRVVVQDVDSYGLGVSDWAEMASGFNPSSFTATGTSNYHGTLLADLATENVVTVSATKATATEPAPATAATDMGTITITRGGVLLFSTITVPLNWSGTAIPGVDYSSMPTSVTIPAGTSSVTLTVVPMANANLQTGATATVNVMPGGGYTIGTAQSASVVINAAGNTNGTGLTGMYFNGTSKTVTPYQPTVLFAGTPALTRVDPMVDFNWSSGSPGTGVNATYFGARWKGQVQPQYSETYYFDVTADDGCMLWVNGQLILSSWSKISGDRLAGITLQAGVLYDIQLDYYQATGADSIDLYWYSNDQTRQIIPTNRLYPLTSPAAAPAITSPLTAIGFVNQPFTFNVTASTSGGVAPTFGLGAGSGPLPPGLTLNAATGLISGTATATGNYEIALTASNPEGVGASVLDIQILPAGSGVTRELWNGLPDSSIASIPLTTTPASTDNQLATLEDDATYGNNTGERLRGYFTPPATGNYYFWLAASNNAELWVSDDNQPVNLVRRAWVTAPGTGSENWNSGTQTNQQSQWLALTAGQPYYYEVYHNTGASAGSTSNVSVAWLLDATGTSTSPTGSGVVPAYLLTSYAYPAVQAAGGTLYSTNLSPVAGVTTSAAGSASLQLNAAQTQAILQFSYTDLSSPQTSYAVYGPDDNGTTTILFDLNVIDKFHPNLKTPTGGYIWNIASTSAVSTSTIINDIEQGLAFLQIETVDHSAGEIAGHFFLVIGSQTAPTPAPDPGYTNDSSTDAGAARFLNQAAFGAAPADMAAVESEGYPAWITNQMSLPATHTLPVVNSYAALVDNNSYVSTCFQNAWWNVSMNAPDQLRQRVALALSEIMVISDQNASLEEAANGLGSYYDTLEDNAFGNFRTLLEAVTLHPGMGAWLDMEGNAKGNLATGYHPDENYAREIMQLFTIGLNRLWPDGTTVLNSLGEAVPTYDQNTITGGFARVFTGWAWNQPLQASGQLPTSFYPTTNWTAPMVMVKNYHELGTKTILDNVVLPAAVGYSLTAAPVAGSQADTTTSAYDSYCLGDLEAGLNNIFNHPNVGPFICRELIQRLVESNPSPGYLARVVQIFNDDGTASHVRGNMAAVIRAILLDGEARNPAIAAANAASGKQREPLLRIAAPARTFLSASNGGTYSQSGSQVMTITTTNPNQHSGGDSVWLDFSPNDTGSPPVAPITNPSTGAYAVLSTPAPTANSFSVNALGMSIPTYSEPASSSTLTVNTTGPPVGEEVYLDFVTGGIASGVYTVTGTPVSGEFTVTTSGTAATALSGTVLMPKMQAYVYVTTPTGATTSLLTMTTNYNGNLNPGDPVWIQMGSGFELPDGQYTIASVLGSEEYTLASSGTYAKLTSPVCTLYPLVPPPLSRSGAVNLSASAFNMGNTNSTLAQTPLDSPTVFNFYYPNYEYPGNLATYNVTTPEFQLTTASNIINLTNIVASTILTSNNTDGLSSFQNGAINLDLSAYMGAPYCSFNTVTTTSGTKVTATTTTTVNASGLVTKLANILTGGMLSQASQQTIVSFISNTTNYPITSSVTGTTTSPPAAPSLPTTQARDIVRAAVQAILTSPEYSIQQ
jgi:uncharacterized protein (DUF1800 family)